MVKYSDNTRVPNSEAEVRAILDVLEFNDFKAMVAAVKCHTQKPRS